MQRNAVNWHHRYVQQAAWTHALREYLFEQSKLTSAQRVLEVGCGTGAILSSLKTSAALYGFDFDPAALNECRFHAPTTFLARGDVLSLPYSSQAFDITYCHFFLLWVRDPLNALMEMKRVTKSNGYILAIAEPDYTDRVDKPDELSVIGKFQNESLQRQGADIGIGARLADLFYRVGIRIIETGAIQTGGNDTLSSEEWQNEWAVIEFDLRDSISSEEIARLKTFDERARLNRTRILSVPTYFAWGQV